MAGIRVPVHHVVSGCMSLKIFQIDTVLFKTNGC